MKRQWGLIRVLTLVFSVCVAAQAAEPLLEFESPDQERLYKRLISEYRCLKCQNQNLADSSADLAGDLRREVYTRVRAGASKAAIDRYLTDRYGDFVLYRPPFRPATWLLWLGPFVLLLLALFYAVRLARGRASKAADGGADELDELDGLDQGALGQARQVLRGIDEPPDRH